VDQARCPAPFPRAEGIMTKYRKVVAILLAHLLVGLLACFAWRFARSLPREILEPFVFGYRIRSSLLLFVSLAPALFVSSLLIGFSVEFSANADETVDRWSEILFGYLKEAFILLVVCLALYVALAEGVSPMLERGQSLAVARTLDFHERMDLARRFEAENKFFEAELQAKAALVSWPGNQEAASLIDQLQYKEVNAAGGNADGSSPSSVSAAGDPKGITALQALDRALEAEKKNDFYNAHYYATMAARLAPETDPNREIATRLAAKAWNEISAGLDHIFAAGERALFDAKKEGYNAIQNGDYLRAYYLFLDLQKRVSAEKENQIDPDVERFLAIARNGMLQTFFFIDETVDMDLYESARDVFFVIRYQDGSSGAFYSRGITYTRSGGKDVAYLRGFEYASFDRNGKVSYRISAPYAKMLPFPNGNRRYLQPELLLRSVDRAKSDTEIGPSVLEGTVPENEKSILVLDMDFRDFDMIVAANRGPQAMSIIDLWLFAPKAETYGFSRTVYLREILDRLADPFLMLIVALYALIIGWKFRLGKNIPFKFWWIVSIPVFFAVSFLAVSFARYVVGLCIAAIVTLAPGAAVPLLLATLAVWFVGASIHFLFQRSD
jgi:hypothetical protein